MAQFVPQNKVIQLVQQPVQHVVTQQPVFQVLQNSQTFVRQPQQQPIETVGLLKDDSANSNIKKFLFYAPIIFFLVLLIFSSVSYSIAVRDRDGSTRAAIKVLENFGENINVNPITNLRPILAFGANNVEAQCNANEDELVFGTFQEIQSGCVCKKVDINGNNGLSYHSVAKCTFSSDSSCQEVVEKDAVNIKVIHKYKLCATRVPGFKQKKPDETSCGTYTNAAGASANYKQCGDLCYQDPQNTGKCPITEIKISASNQAGFEAITQALDGNKKVYVKRVDADQPVIHIRESISHPLCLSSDLQRPFRKSKIFYKLAYPRESGCLPYGAHELTKSYKDIEVDQDQNTLYTENNIKVQNIPYYKDYIIKAEDKVIFHSHLRFKVENSKVCRDANIEQSAEHARSTIRISDYTINFNLSFIVLSAVGLVLALVLVLLREKNFVNNNYQNLLYAYLLIVAVALLVYPALFWGQSSHYNLHQVKQELTIHAEKNCLPLDGQKDASKHIIKLLNILDNTVYGITIFLFVFDIIFLLAVFYGANLRRKQGLHLCEPLKGSRYFYS